MADDVDSEIKALQAEYNWLLKEEVHSILHELQAILSEACQRFPTQINTEDDVVARTDKFVLTNQNGSNQIKCVLTLMADHICEADVTLRIQKQQTSIINTKLYPDRPWRVQQIQDAGNHLLCALSKVERYDEDYSFQTGHEVLMLLDTISDSLMKGRSCLALPKKKTLEDLINNPTLKSFKPSLPGDVIVSFYVQAQKLMLAVYQLYVNPAQKIDIQSRHQVECSVPWLNDALVLFTLALQQCQQLQDKLVVFLQYEAQSKFLKQPTHLNLMPADRQRPVSPVLPPSGNLQIHNTPEYPATASLNPFSCSAEKKMREPAIKPSNIDLLLGSSGDSGNSVSFVKPLIEL